MSVFLNQLVIIKFKALSGHVQNNILSGYGKSRENHCQLIYISHVFDQIKVRYFKPLVYKEKTLSAERLTAIFFFSLSLLKRGIKIKRDDSSIRQPAESLFL
jgi:hypothetical protein